MVDDKPRLETRPPTRERILDAAERLLAQGGAAFSMRTLADAAELSFATPFNQFGGKAAIMQALSARRIAAMHRRLAQTRLPESAVERIDAAVDIAVSVMLAAPQVNRAVMAAVGAPSEAPGDVSLRSAAFWAEALGTGRGLARSTHPLALAALPGQLAIAFRGVLSFWTASEIDDATLDVRARAAAAAALLGFVGRKGRAALLATLRGCPAWAHQAGDAAASCAD